ncbi:MAG: DUF309 domain-containing protein [Proteobacteria bacterium]|nr:MAG: DUF309 domain-containing protein [Pseudomonadota bacterium]
MRYALPPHAYIPGQTQRHQEEQFDEIISSIPCDIDFETLQTLSAFHIALNFMQHGFHWEAHEILEAIWMNTAQNSIERLFTQCVIHLANANLKHVMKRETATQKIMSQANALSAEIGRRAPDSLAYSEIQKLFLKYAL